jgi:EAP30/Vps36 family.
MTSQQLWSPLTCLPKQTLTPAGLISLDALDNEVQLITRTSIELRSLSPTPLPKPVRMLAADDANNSSTTSNSTSILSWSHCDKNLTVTLTTHRIVFQSSSSSDSGGSGSRSTTAMVAAHFLHHCAIKPNGITAAGGVGGGTTIWNLRKSPKILIESLTHGDLHLVFRSGHKDRDVFLEHFQKAIERRQWEETYRLQQQQMENKDNGRGGPVMRVGVGAILERNQYRHERAKKLTEDAFGNKSNMAEKKKGNRSVFGGDVSTNKKYASSKDKKSQEVENLFREAGELISIIHKYVATLEKNKRNSGNNASDDGGPNTGEEDTTELTGMLQGMGMITALTRESAEDKMFHELLARQICDFLSENKAFKTSLGGSGIMTLTDVYCLYNRARGANMISPEDLLEALEKMEGLGLGMKLREFDASGVKVLQEIGFDDSVMAKKLMEYMDRKEEEDEGGKSGDAGIVMSYFLSVSGSGGRKDTKNDGRKMHVGVTSLEAARILKISPLLANEQLLAAERNGYLCRDVTLEGTRFFRNRLVTY